MRTQREESLREGESKRRRGGEVELRGVEEEGRRRKGEEEEGRSREEERRVGGDEEWR